MRRRLLAPVFIAIVLAACTIAPQPGKKLPSTGEPQVGVAYRITLYCPVPIEVGDSVWTFTDSERWPPDRAHWPWESIGSPYPVPGIFTLHSTEDAVFRADVDGSELHLARGRQSDLDEACL